MISHATTIRLLTLAIFAAACGSTQPANTPTIATRLQPTEVEACHIPHFPHCEIHWVVPQGTQVPPADPVDWEEYTRLADSLNNACLESHLENIPRMLDDAMTLQSRLTSVHPLPQESSFIAAEVTNLVKCLNSASIAIRH